MNVIDTDVFKPQDEELISSKPDEIGMIDEDLIADHIFSPTQLRGALSQRIFLFERCVSCGRRVHFDWDVAPKKSNL